VNGVDPLGLLTFKVGNFAGAGAGVSFQNQGAIAVDTSGNVALVGTLSAGGEFGVTGSVGVVASVSTAPTVFDEAGSSVIVGGSAGEGATVGVDTVAFRDREGNPQGAVEAQLGLGAGSPLEVHAQGGGTVVIPLFNIPDALGDLLDSVLDWLF